jgi:asparagine synthase (glutamine-hydrolysing)
MCGIAGIISKTGVAVERSSIEAMTQRVAHRGPDGEGVACYGALALGHRRLSILDLSKLGAQPMSYGDSGLTIIHNGEIYNYRELRHTLRMRGYAFKSDSDTEVILAAYDAWGDACVEHFNGMWAFAIYDAKRQRLFCSRDRFGVKPFYYATTAEQFLFGSEIRQILPFLSSVTANQSVIETFLVGQGNELGNTTYFNGILRLPGGHNLTYDLGTHSYNITRYYSITRQPQFAALSRDEAAEALFATLSDAVKFRLRSDVKVGTCLSGGLDSSSIATIAASLYAGGAFSAITAVSEQENNNEEAYAQQIVENSGLNWVRITPRYSDFTDALPHIVETQEEPFDSASIVMQYFVMKAARANGITVLLDGQGGDETLLGYERYYATHLLTILREQGMQAMWAEMQNIRRHNSKMRPLTMAKYLVAGSSSHLRYGVYARGHRYLKHIPPCPPYLKALAGSVRSAWDMQTLEITETNLPLLLRFEDKNSMAHAIETRLPFLDYRVVEMALSLPTHYKMHDGWTKWLLRKAMDKKMPDSITWRKNKLGFEAPEAIWLTTHDATMKSAIIASPLLRELARDGALENGFHRLATRTKFRLYSIALWEAQFGVSNLQVTTAA